MKVIGLSQETHPPRSYHVAPAHEKPRKGALSGLGARRAAEGAAGWADHGVQRGLGSLALPGGAPKQGNLNLCTKGPLAILEAMWRGGRAGRGLKQGLGREGEAFSLAQNMQQAPRSSLDQV